IVAVATAAMQARLLPFLAARGVSAHELTLYTYGGAGPTHAFLLAQELGIDRVMVPPSPGALCAVGCLVADLRVDMVHNERFGVAEADVAAIRRHLNELSARGIVWARAQAVGIESVESVNSLDMRYAGQSFELNVPIDVKGTADEIREAFERKYES